MNLRINTILAGVMIIGGCLVNAALDPVPNALYAELHGGDRCYRVFKGLDNSLSPWHNRFCFRKPCTKFYNNQGKVLRTEFGAVDRLAVKAAAKRLTELPIVHGVELHIGSKGVADEGIVLVDKLGNDLAYVHRYRHFPPFENVVNDIKVLWTQPLTQGDVLPEPAYAMLSQYVANKEQLKNMRIGVVFDDGVRQK